jgi:hypothetical protein
VAPGSHTQTNALFGAALSVAALTEHHY